MKHLVLLIFLITAFLLLEKHLDYYGFGYGIFRSYLPYGFNTDYERNDGGFNIEEQGFINIIEKGMVINSYEIEQIKMYSVYNDKLYVYAVTQKGEKIIQTIVNQNGHMGEKIERLFLDPKAFKTKEDFEWIDVTSNKLMLRILFYSLQLSVVILIFRIAYKFIKLKVKTACNTG